MMKSTNQTCPSCSTGGLSIIYEVSQVPVHSVILHHTREEATAYPTGDIDLGYCQACGFVTNTAFDPSVQEYDAEYESTQAFSPTFNAFHRTLATDLIERFDLRGKQVVEIGCGQGEFLKMLCEIGGNSGVGFDPAYIGPPSIQESSYNITFIPDFYSEKYTDFKGDFFCCKMTLEHIHQTRQFITTVRQAIGQQANTVVFFQVPNARYVFGDLAFWDIYYEHCSYFTIGSLARLFRAAGFEVMDLWSGYDDQYIMIEAKPSTSTAGQALPQEERVEDFGREIERFTELTRKKSRPGRNFSAPPRHRSQCGFMGWRLQMRRLPHHGGLLLDQIELAVDVNPRKNNTYLAGTGQKWSPRDLKTSPTRCCGRHEPDLPG